jgi:hypothetical protein
VSRTPRPCPVCLIRTSARAGGLCASCYRSSDNRAAYPSQAVRGRGLTETGRACGPTTANPGSEEKIRVMIERLELGQPLFHDDDPFEHTRTTRPRTMTIEWCDDE